jgi:type 1 glutamine amidotransferase
VQVHDRVSAVLSRLDDALPPPLLVINAGSAEEATASDRMLLAAIVAHVNAGRSLLVMHVASTLFVDSPEWETIVGGRWVRGVTMHPDWGDVRVTVDRAAHPITTGVRDFVVQDEGYARLRVSEDVVVLAHHEYEGERHPLLWATTHKHARVVFDALGHDARSYDSTGHAEVVARSARWLLGELN